MTLLIVAFPEFSPSDLERLAELRARNDPQAGLIAPHFTLVFPTEATDQAEAVRHAETVAARWTPFTIRLTAAVAVPDTEAERSHVFLTPAAGWAEIARLHDHLYAGVLAPALRTDIEYLPHVTVAAFPDHAQAVALAANIARLGVDMVGAITAIEVLSFDGGAVETLRKIEFG
ncbi:2'-5' RNA ligase family protein [Phenylobacterium sp.]|uniref:2'-5' RNA ligase family protein n=1 Tax=Phenylobacterium sp. TaxID=1871053 RepID=UPI002736705E|nr:2'-5' RNA ligase family protein [Phenylobacterium sp.]MDP3855139.1 2'-5' RNA ligase family protein [Phenylobacterium sp.]